MSKRKFFIILLCTSIAGVLFIGGLIIGSTIDNPSHLPFVKRKTLEWSIGIYTGPSPLDLSDGEIKNPVLTHKDVVDARARFVADPFMIFENDMWYMFFEVLNIDSNQGDIAFATSKDGKNWIYRQICVNEDFHLSYPYIFKWQGEFYMIPESRKKKSIRLYKANAFPTEWSYVKDLIRGRDFKDSSIFRHDNKWWMFTETNPNFTFDTLRLYFSDKLAGPWQEHPQSPVINGNANIARPGGRIIHFENQPIRFAQDADPVYGKLVRAFTITRLTTMSYDEKEVNKNPILIPSGSGWNAFRMHHVDPHKIGHQKWIACVDARGEHFDLQLK